MTNPVAKPPRLTDIHQYNATGQLSANGAVTINGTVFHPTNGNPDAKAIGNSTSNPGKKMLAFNLVFRHKACVEQLLLKALLDKTRFRLLFWLLVSFWRLPTNLGIDKVAL